MDNNCNGQIDETCPIISWGNVYSPYSTTTSVGVTTESIYGQVYSAGVTDNAGQGSGIWAILGYGPDGSDPADGGWTWVDATYNADSGNFDEYVATLTISTSGTYDYAFAYSGDQGNTWLYCDTNAGSTDGYSPFDTGNLIVNP